MKNLKHIFLAIISLTIASSCSNFEELNTDPNAPASVSPDMLATQVLKNTYRFWNPNPTDFGTNNLWCKHTAMLETNPNPYQYYYSYWPFGGFGSYKNLTDLKRMVEFAEGSGDPILANSYKGLALYLKAYYGYTMTMDMGDVPYSEAGMAEEGITRPKYDKQADVFVSILKDLQAAEAFFATGKKFGGDIMYGGDNIKWQRLCNAMQLKVIQTISKKATAEQKARFAAIVNANKLMVGNADNFQLVYTDTPNATHPFWNGENRRIYISASKLIVDELKKVNDRRLFIFAEPARYLTVSTFNDGVGNGTGTKQENDFDAYEGAPTELSADALAVNRSAGKYSFINKRYKDIKAGDPMIHFSYAEQCFIIAEAIEEGWVTGVAKDYYENGVKAMLHYFRTLPSASTGNHGMAITQAYIDGYFTGNAAYAATKTDRLHQIWVQRWLIDFFQGNGLNYKNFLRTGYPLFPLDPATSMNPDDKTKYPKRWKYPTDEQVSNPDNYNLAISALGGYDGINIVPWWLQ